MQQGKGILFLLGGWGVGGAERVTDDVGSRIGKLFSIGNIVDQWEALLKGVR